MRYIFLIIVMAASSAAIAISPEVPQNKAAMQDMHKKMMAPYTGDADADFVSHMIPHHQGAVDMAKIELQNGRDPELRKLAQDIIDSQAKEIKQMQSWQADHNQTPTQP